MKILDKVRCMGLTFDINIGSGESEPTPVLLLVRPLLCHSTQSFGGEVGSRGGVSVVGGYPCIASRWPQPSQRLMSRYCKRKYCVM